MKTLLLSVAIGTVVIRLMDENTSWTSALRTASVAFTVESILRKALA